MTHKVHSFLAASSCALLMASCGIINRQTPVVATPTTTETTQKVENTTIPESIYGEWIVSNAGGKAVTGENRPYVILEKTASSAELVNCYANDGCNTLNGSYKITPIGTITPAAEFASTMRLCADAPYENAINKAIIGVRNYKIEQNGNTYTLSFTNAEGQTLMTLTKSDISFINGAWTVTRIGSTEVKFDDGLKMVIDIAELKVHGNAGCNVLNGSIYIAPDKQNALQFRDLITTRMTCPNMALERQLLIALEQVESVAKGTSENTALLKDASGETVIELKRLNLKK